MVTEDSFVDYKERVNEIENLMKEIFVSFNRLKNYSMQHSGLHVGYSQNAWVEELMGDLSRQIRQIVINKSLFCRVVEGKFLVKDGALFDLLVKELTGIHRRIDKHMKKEGKYSSDIFADVQIALHVKIPRLNRMLKEKSLSIGLLKKKIA